MSPQGSLCHYEGGAVICIPHDYPRSHWHRAGRTRRWQLAWLKGLCKITEQDSSFAQPKRQKWRVVVPKAFGEMPSAEAAGDMNGRVELCPPAAHAMIAKLAKLALLPALYHKQRLLGCF